MRARTQPTGLNRIHQATWLVCKAGSGLAGAMFHSRLLSALKKGVTLEDALEKRGTGTARYDGLGSPLPESRRASWSYMGKALDILLMDGVPDQASNGRWPLRGDDARRYHQ